MSVSAIDCALAQRLERVEASTNAAFVEARARTDPEVGATWTEIAGAYAMFDGVGSPLTQSFGVGMFAPFEAAAFGEVERFFLSRGAAAHHEIAEFSPTATTALLEARGYSAIERSTVLVRGIAAGVARAADVTPETRATNVTVRRIAAGELDGAPIAASALHLIDGVALLAGASTVPSARGRGAQRALLDARLTYAAAHGADLAMVVTEPGSASQRNAERAGFRPVYGRTKWERRPG